MPHSTIFSRARILFHLNFFFCKEKESVRKKPLQAIRDHIFTCKMSTQDRKLLFVFTSFESFRLY